MPAVDDAIEEVVHGEMRIMPPNKWKHAVIVENLARALGSQVNAQEVLVVITQFGLTPPELIAEVLSPANTRAERAQKLRDPESLGVPEVWVISPEAPTIEVLQLQGDTLRTQQVATQGQLSAKYFPGVSVEVSSIWPD